jgi:DNA-binding response OmpR family regulator
VADDDPTMRELLYAVLAESYDVVSVTDEVAAIAIGMGADDYLAKPFGVEALKACVQMLLRKSTVPGV